MSLMTRDTMDAVNMTNTAIRVMVDTGTMFLIYNLRKFIEQFGLYYTMLVIASCLFGNLLSLVVFWRVRRKNNVTASYLFPIAFYDILVLFNGIADWLQEASFSFSNGAVYIRGYYSQGHCLFMGFLFFGCGLMSTWTLIMFCVERCIAIRCPLKVVSIYTPSRRGVILLLVVIFSTIGGVLPLPSYALIPNEAYDGGGICIPVVTNTLQLVLTIVAASVLYSFLPSRGNPLVKTNREMRKRTRKY
jgi:hypothetical protein